MPRSAKPSSRGRAGSETSGKGVHGVASTVQQNGRCEFLFSGLHEIRTSGISRPAVLPGRDLSWPTPLHSESCTTS
jgi:hypothetical protein